MIRDDQLAADEHDNNPLELLLPESLRLYALPDVEHIETKPEQPVIDYGAFSVDFACINLPSQAPITKPFVNHPGSSVIIPLNEQGEVGIIREYKASIAQYLVQFPCGTRKDNEAFFDCAVRELAEEVQLKATTWNSIGQLVPAPGTSNEIFHGFVATGLSSSDGKRDPDEVIFFDFMDPLKLEEYLVTSSLTTPINSQSLLFLSLALRNNLI